MIGQYESPLCYINVLPLCGSVSGFIVVAKIIAGIRADKSICACLDHCPF